MRYFICYACRVIWCTHAACKAPHCADDCRPCFTPDNGEYTFCNFCVESMLAEFKHQIDGKRRLRIEG